jgi:hypothetical protein
MALGACAESRVRGVWDPCGSRGQRSSRVMTSKSVEAAGCSAPRSWRLRSAACRPHSFGARSRAGTST